MGFPLSPILEPCLLTPTRKRSDPSEKTFRILKIFVIIRFLLSLHRFHRSQSVSPSKQSSVMCKRGAIAQSWKLAGGPPAALQNESECLAYTPFLTNARAGVSRAGKP
jgi:hypothetical protein